MILLSSRPLVRTGLGLLGGFLLTLAGCGGKGPESGDAVVVPGPEANVPASGAVAPATPPPSVLTPSPPTPSSASAPASTPSATTAAASPAKVGEWGTLTGQVTLKGKAPASKVLAPKGQASKDPEMCAKDAPIMSERLVVDSGTGGVKNVLVYLPKPTSINEEAKSNALTAQFTFDQKNCIFEPHVMAVMVGAKVELKNSDPKPHNINSRLRNNGYNKLLAGLQSVAQPVDAAERSPGEITCDIHNWMKAYWMVLDNPYFAVTDAQGNYEIKNVPSGTQKVVAWQEGVGFVTAPSGDPVDIKAGEPTSRDFTVDVAKLKPE